MKKLKEMKKWLPRMSRKRRIVCNLLISLIPLVFIWTILECPLPAMWQFRRSEQAMLVGPSEVLAVVRSKNLAWDEAPEKLAEYLDEHGRDQLTEHLKNRKTVIVGECGDILTCFIDHGFIWNHFPFYWQSCFIEEKNGEVTLWPIYTEHYASTYYSENGEEEGNTRLVTGALIAVQTDLPGAYHASLEWRSYIKGTDTIDTFTNWCSGTGTVQGEGVFVIPVLMSSDPVADNEGINGRFDRAEAHLVLTDENGTVIYDEVLIVEE